MKLRNFSTTFTIEKEGDTGYDNKSELTFFTQRGGKIIMPYKNWEESDIPTTAIAKVELIIPSGVLLIENLGGSPVTVSHRDQDISFSGDYCHWDGNIAGLFGGMSGYGSHCFAPNEETFVYEGTYLAPVKGWDGNTVSLNKYLQRIATADVLFDYSPKRVEYDGDRIQGNISDQEWLEYIAKLDKAYIEEMFATEIRQAAYYCEGEDLRPKRCKDLISDQEWLEFVEKLQMKYKK